jgi:DNA-directed RNA polymerase II subunit RPB7
MAFYLVELTKTVTVHPRHFHAKLADHVVSRLLTLTEGTTSGRYGYLIAVVQVERPLPPGRILPGTGHAAFPLRYKALVYRPFLGEVLDGVITSVTRHGVFVSVGPLSVFVSARNVPSDLEFDETEHCFASVLQGSEDRLEVGTLVRLRIVGMRRDATEIAAVGTLRADYLGVLG